ncbi:MAG: hypothetical protein RIQ93_3533, partial [Verrucomicrobiota bacterium]
MKRLVSTSLFLILLWLQALTRTGAAESVSRDFDVTAGEATETLKHFAMQANREIMFSPDALAGEKTMAVKGHWNPREALDRMLAGSSLQGIEDSPTGALMVIRAPQKLSSETQQTSPLHPKTMKSKNPLTLLIAWMGLALAPAEAARAAEATTAVRASVGQEAITGVVTNAATGRTLEGARVVLQGTGRETLTDNQGTYRFSEVAPGSAVISVSYTGLTTVAIPVTVAAGTANRRDVGLTSDIYTLSKFVVSGEREGNALAITMQRNSTGVRNVVSADAFGSLDGNPADLLVRLPGVSGTTQDGDFRFVQIRGMSQQLSSITRDGDRMASGNQSGSREFQFLAVSSESIERFEVVKSPTPDMDAD